MRRCIAVALIVASCGPAATTSTTDPPPVGPAPTDTVPTTAPLDPASPSSETTSRSTPTTTTSPTTTDPAHAVDRREGWFGVSITGWLPDAFLSGLVAIPGVSDVSVVWVGNAMVVQVSDAGGEPTTIAPDGMAIPIDLHAVNPTAHAAFVPPEVASLLGALAPDDVVLGHRSAEFRGIGVGARFVLEDGTALHVRGVVDDRWIGGAEAATTAPDPAKLGADRPRYAVLRFDGPVEVLEAAVDALADLPVKVRSEAEVPILRHADAVQPQIAVKARFGEFAFRPADGRSIDIDPLWLDANIVTRDIPLLGAVTCHRDFLPTLESVMTLLEMAGPRDVIDPDAFLGCFNSRMVTGRRDISRHSWGIAADINFTNDLDEPGSPTSPELLAVMELFGVTSGHDWSVPDPGHFEWVGVGFDQ